MRVNDFAVWLGAVFLGAVLFGCSFSVSVSTKQVLTGKDKIAIEAKQPPKPKPAPAPIKIKPVLKAKVVGKKIEISEKVMFEFDKAIIKIDSHGLLGDVAKVLEEHGDIDKIRIEGHTDSEGKNSYNKKLSQKRADAVKAFLVQAGIDESRLEAVGYGEERPVGDNATDDGREKNRRVEFNILKRKSGSEGEEPEPK